MAFTPGRRRNGERPRRARADSSGCALPSSSIIRLPLNFLIRYRMLRSSSLLVSRLRLYALCADADEQRPFFPVIRDVLNSPIDGTQDDLTIEAWREAQQVTPLYLASCDKPIVGTSINLQRNHHSILLFDWHP